MKERYFRYPNIAGCPTYRKCQYDMLLVRHIGITGASGLTPNLPTTAPGRL